MNPSEIAQLQTTILNRYEKEKRPLPRRNTKDPYAIHISEVMSQQTQVDRVIPYWERRMQEIPNYETLAELPKLELLSHRSGLGFNSRALRLQTCAKTIIENYQGKLPKDREELLNLPGIWPYTASAICAFARNQPEPVIDTNIRRVLIFLLKLEENISLQELEKKAKILIPEGRSRDRHNALMDYGATHLTARKTNIKSLGKQSKFEGSDREVSGRILKQLTKKWNHPCNLKPPLRGSKADETNQAQKQNHWEKNFLTLSQIQAEFPHKDIQHIVQVMGKEHLLKQEKEKIWIE